jgi:hypothetical protein
MHLMRNTLVYSLLAAAGFLLTANVMAADAPEGEVLLTQAVRNTVQANVEYVDIINRDVKLQMPDGEIVEFKAVDPKVTNFDKLQLNDKVNVAGTEAVVIVLSKGTAGIRRIEVAEGRDVTADGIGVLKTRSTYNDIIAVDHEKNNVRVKNPDNQFITIPVANKELLNKAAVGDQLVVIARVTVSVWGNGNQ